MATTLVIGNFVIGNFSFRVPEGLTANEREESTQGSVMTFPEIATSKAVARSFQMGTALDTCGS